MNEDFAAIAITALLPLTACMLVCQVNPYHALVIRGILGAVAALVYALFGAADVALTEALVGTMLSITLYAVAVRSSMSMRLGVLETSERKQVFAQLVSALRQPLSKYHLRLELVTYSNFQALQTALIAKEVHTTCVLSQRFAGESPPLLTTDDGQPLYQIQTRVQRLYHVMQAELSSTMASLIYVEPASLDLNADQPSDEVPNPVEFQS